MVKQMENMLRADPLLDMDINPYSLPEVDGDIDRLTEMVDKTDYLMDW